MTRYIANLFILLSSFICIHGQVNQYGLPFITNYPFEITKGSEINWAIAQDHRGVIYIGNDDKGILEYDGSEWRNINTPNRSIVRSLDVDENGRVYVGAVAEFGYLTPDESGDLQYRSLVPLLKGEEEKRFADVWKTYCGKDKVYFYSEKSTMVYYPETDSIFYVLNNIHVLFGFLVNDSFYVGDFAKGLIEFVGDSVMTPAKGGEYYIEKDIYGLAKYDEDHLIISTFPYGLSLYNTKTGAVNDNFSQAATKEFVENNFITSIRALSNGDFLLASAENGMIVIDKNGSLKETISTEQGLQNMSVYNIYESKIDYAFPQVWSALSIGVSKVDIPGPFRKITGGEEQLGLINSINSIGNNIFLATFTGIYSLSKENKKISLRKLANGTFWDLQKFNLQNGEEVLLSIADASLFQIHKDGRIIDLVDKIKNIDKDEDKQFNGYCIYRSSINPNKIYLGRETSITELYYNNGNWYQEFFRDTIHDEIRSVAINTKEKLWFAQLQEGIGCLSPLTHDGKVTYFTEKDGLPTKEDNSLYEIDGEIYVGTTNGIYNILDYGDSVKFVPDTVYNKYLPGGKNEINKIYKDKYGFIWISFENINLGYCIYKLEPVEEGFKVYSKPFYRLENASSDAFCTLNKTDVWFSKSNILYHYNDSIKFKEGSFKTLVRKVIVNNNQVIFNGANPGRDKNGNLFLSNKQNQEFIPHLKHADNNFEIRFSAPFFDQEEKLEYSFFLEGFSENWTQWDSEVYQDFTNLSHGSYNFRVKARNVYLDESEEASFRFVVSRPWYLRFYAFIFYILLAIFIVYQIIALYTRRLKNENIRLEGIIQDRTAEIRKQKEELTDSIEYASRIQRALLPPDNMLNEYGVDHFILFRPRDIVSGDFYWFGSNKDKVFIVGADCTGHGVPGAFMSMLGISFLDEIVIKTGISETNEILNSLKKHVITSLKQTGQDMADTTKDGMDLAMISIDKTSGDIQFSGAYNPLYAVRELNEEERQEVAEGKELELERGSVHNDTHLLYQVKGDPMPIGISEKEFEFTAKSINDPNATFYILSDGYVDQFGGPHGKKFLTKNLKKLLLEIQDLSLEKQKKKLNDTLNEWMGNISQIDDILVIGIKLSK